MKSRGLPPIASAGCPIGAVGFLCRLCIIPLQFHVAECNCPASLRLLARHRYGIPATNVYDHNGWVLIESAAGSTASAELLTKRIFDVVDIRNLKDLKAAHPGIEVVLSIIVYVTSSAPSVSLSKEQVKFLATIEGDLDIDIYPMSEPSGSK